jgi:glycosyltransferase involved in cell wall biosynthesis
MNIAFISPYPPSKVTLNEYGYHLTRSFVGKEGIENIHILTNHLENNDDYERYAMDGLNIVPCWKFDNYFTVIHILRQVLKLKPDAVIFNLQFMTFGERKIPSALGLMLPWLCKLFKIPTIVLIHNITETVDLENIGMSKNKWISKLLLWIGKKITEFLLKADLIGVTISQYIDILNEKYKTKNVILLPHGNFDLPERVPVPEPIDTVNLMAFGKFGTYKKVEVMIEATAMLEKKYPNLKFISTVAGTDNPNVKGYLDGVKEKYGHMKNLLFTGYVAEEDVPRIFQDSTFVIFPYNTTTGSSGILHQAGSYARACILPKIDDLERVVEEEGYGGAYFEIDNAESLTAAVSHLIDHPDERKEIEDMNYAAAKGLPMPELAEWYMSHLEVLINKYKKK